MNEKLSALMDGELAREEAHIVIKKLGADEQHREDWDAYHLIGSCLRGEAVTRAPAGDRCTEAIFSRLAAEPTVIAPAALRKPVVGDSRTRLVLAMAASVVTVSAVSVIALKQQQGASVAPVKLVQQIAPQPLADSSAGSQAGSLTQRAQADVRVNDYLVVHRQFANPNAFQPAALSRSREVPADNGKLSAGR